MTEKGKRARAWKRFRKKNRFSQVRLASVLGCSKQTVLQIENSRRVPRKRLIHKFEILKEKYEPRKSTSESPCW